VKYIAGTSADDLVVTLGTLDSEATPGTVTMDATGDNALFCFDGTAWVVIENNIA
jgi:multisubunit Na+/H+ antiporter MnhE subunit